MKGMSERIAVIGLGYVGLPVALAFAAKFPGTVGFDIDERRVAALAAGEDWTGETSREELNSVRLTYTHNQDDLKGADVFIVCVPTPIDDQKRPDLRPLRGASETVGRALKRGTIVCYESTVYPGLTEDFCGPILAKVSGLNQGSDFRLGYSPERINPGDKEHSLARIVKVVAGEDKETAATLARLYGDIVTAGIHVAPSIKVAEAAKVLENTQRDLNIALMNELALICDRLDIRTADVLKAARTKWNFLPFSPGLVGGHCIGVDPYYLTTKAETLGYHPDVILAGRRINDGVGAFIAQRLVRFLSRNSTPLSDARVAILGLTFKENVSDTRNSRVPDILRELMNFGVRATVSDPKARPEDAVHEYGIALTDLSQTKNLDALVLAVPHREFLGDPTKLFARLKPQGVLIDVKSVIDPASVPSGITYWSL
ncbi:MAG: nucleotide sugar dehydrogenase [Alphaproteobacteria bacterium]|nr:nucleotide sugar dehydrogenase [Alphaproteobacteria bacterium]